MKVSKRTLITHIILEFIELVLVPVLALAVPIYLITGHKGTQLTMPQSLKYAALIRFSIYGVINMIKGDLGE